MQNPNTPPSDKAFEEIKAKSILLWMACGESKEIIKQNIALLGDIKNIKNNALCIVEMFNEENRRKLLHSLSEEAQEWLHPFLEWEATELLQTWNEYINP